jgi:hypothetical protein
LPADRYLFTPLSLGNVDDVEAFARSKLRRLPNGMFLRPDEIEDEVANVIEQLVDWYRPVDPIQCIVCRRRRGQQHAWDCDALPPERVRRNECLGCGVERYLEEQPVTVSGCTLATGEEWTREVRLLSRHVDGCVYADGKGGWGCRLCGCRRGELHARDCERRHERQQRYDPAKTDDFALFARFRLDTYYIPDLCRRLLGRNGGRIAERSHSELDERAESGRRPWEAAAPEQDGLRAHLAPHPGGEEAGRDRARARGAALLGLRPA